MELHLYILSWDGLYTHNIRKKAAFSCDVTYIDLGRSRMMALGCPYDRLMQSLI